jgi:NAD(P)-dependent dehydrogenase (short-subunit alcohol dehydrogenase family)
MQEPTLAGKVALVTGAGNGIGRALAVALAAAGAQIVVNDVGAGLSGAGASASPAHETQALIEQAGSRAVISTDSVADWDGAQRMVRLAVGEFGRLDIVVNCAGILRDAIFHKMAPDDWRAVLDVHLHGSFLVSRAAADVFRQQGAGAFVHLTSTSGLIGNLGQAAYSAAKLGIVALSRSIAIDMQRFGVRSNCVAPFAWSRMTETMPTQTAEQARYADAMRKVTPEKNAPLVVYLASDAARDVSGQIFVSRGNEIFLMNQIRPQRGAHSADGWTPQTVAERAMPALRASFTPLEGSEDVFHWLPV